MAVWRFGGLRDLVLLQQAGSRPGGRLTCSLLRQRKVSKRKASRLSGPLVRFPALLAPRGVWLNSLRSDNASPDPLASALLGPANRRVEIKTKAQANQYAPRRVPGAFEFGLCFCVCLHHPCGRAEQRKRAGWPRKDACLSEASLRPSPAGRAAQGAWSASARSRAPGSPFFCLRFFGEGKKSRSAAGPSPGLLAHDTAVP